MYYQNPMVMSKGNALKRSTIRTNLGAEEEKKKALASHLENLN